MQVIDQIQEKIQRIAVSRNFSMWPVLIHVNGVTEAVKHSGFFSRIIDFGEFLTANSE